MARMAFAADAPGHDESAAVRADHATTERMGSTLLCIIPAHNEAATIGASIAGIRAQQQDATARIIVVSDNSTDDTEAIATAAGAEVLTTKGNQGMYGKLAAGAGVVGGGVLPITGMSIAGVIISGIVLIFAGLATLKLIPKRRHHDD